MELNTVEVEGRDYLIETIFDLIEEIARTKMVSSSEFDANLLNAFVRKGLLFKYTAESGTEYYWETSEWYGFVLSFNELVA